MGLGQERPWDLVTAKWLGWDSPLVLPKGIWRGRLHWAGKCCLAPPSAEGRLGGRQWAGGREQPADGRAGSLHRAQAAGEQATAVRGWSSGTARGLGATVTGRGPAGAVGSLLSLAQGLQPGTSSPSVLRLQRRGVAGPGPGGRQAQGLSQRRVPGHLSHRKGTRRRVKVAVKV